MKTDNLIGTLLDSITSEETARIENRMLISAKIADAMKEKGWKKKDLMQALGKHNQSEITRWLSGTHNFTCDTLTDIQRVLEVKLLCLDKEDITIRKFKFLPIVVKPTNAPYSNHNDIVGAQSFQKHIFHA
jgi:transcriptional regulator with XRE-family HTH domain